MKTRIRREFLFRISKSEQIKRGLREILGVKSIDRLIQTNSDRLTEPDAVKFIANSLGINPKYLIEYTF